MRKAIVTGATSFIGRHLIKRLLAEGWKVYAIVRKHSLKIGLLPESERLEVICLEIEEYSRLKEVIKEPCDVYVSLAWNGTRGEARSDAMLQQKNYECSMEALKAVQLIGCKTVISAGSQAEYGHMEDKTDEKCICRPNTEYGKWKLQYYKEASAFCQEKEIAFKEPRFFSLFGEDDYEQTMVLSILDDMLYNRPCRLTECVQLWDFLYIDDAIDGVYRLMTMECEDGAYNFGSGDTRPLKEFVMEMYRLSGSHSELLFGAIPYPATGMVNVYPDIAKLRKQTGWESRRQFSEGIKALIEYKRQIKVVGR